MCHRWHRSQFTRSLEEDEGHIQIPGVLRTGRRESWGEARAQSHMWEMERASIRSAQITRRLSSLSERKLIFVSAAYSQGFGKD